MLNPKPKYQLSNDGKFSIINYNWAKSFSSFFPGIAGTLGVPMWIFYVNRNQAISSFGIRDKDHQILEFQSFNKALASISTQGFRTFIKIDNKIYEPFIKTKDNNIIQKLTISSAEIEIEETNKNLELKTKITYFPLVNTNVPALIRQIKIENIRKKDISIELLDGLPRILPLGMDLHCTQVIPRHIEGMIGVYDYKKIPLFRLKQTHKDSEKIGQISGGNFYYSFLSQNNKEPNIIVDPSLIFEDPEIYDYAWNFENNSIDNIIKQTQVKQNRTPCAFTGLKQTIKKGGILNLYSAIGNVDKNEKLTKLKEKLLNKDFLKIKQKENNNLINQIKNKAFTKSAISSFDHYISQTFLDNVARGGMPITFGKNENKKIFYIYSKQNGDLERDYHYFILEPTYLSQGTGHYRSILQNRRNDTWFFPEIMDFNIKLYMDLTQLDGYNPLEVLGSSYKAKDINSIKKILSSLEISSSSSKKLIKMIQSQFTPGQFLMCLEEENINIENNYEQILCDILANCEEYEVGAIHEGFWVDHWAYNLDTIDNFLMIYPDKLADIIFEDNSYTFFDNPDVIMPRKDKYKLIDGKLYQYDSVKRDKEKLIKINSRKDKKYTVRIKYGDGEIYKTTLFVKLLNLVTIRMATLDANNIGIEMEANKPGWNDSTNGLPGIFGSTLCHRFELERTCTFLLQTIDNCFEDKNSTILIYEELSKLIGNLFPVIEQRLYSDKENKEYIYWDKSNTVKEAYREKTKFGVSGKEIKISVQDIINFLKKSLELLQEPFTKNNTNKLFNKDGIAYTYYINTPKPTLPECSTPGVKDFTQRPTALFLEGSVHCMKIHPEFAQKLYTAIKKSNIFDEKLKMYKVCESLENETFEIGRIKAWGAGWIENESIYTHMEYKYLLEILRAGLFDEYYSDIKNTLMCFLDPAIYGRNIIENVSFIVSSAFPDKNMHGQGLQPRLSGVTNEMLSMWILMVAGPNPFYLDENNNLKLKLKPALPNWLFNKSCHCEEAKGRHGNPTFTFTFLGNTTVTYINNKNKNTYGKDAAKITSYTLTDNNENSMEVKGDIIDTDLALKVRNGEIKNIIARLD